MTVFDSLIQREKLRHTYPKRLTKFFTYAVATALLVSGMSFYARRFKEPTPVESQAAALESLLTTDTQNASKIIRKTLYYKPNLITHLPNTYEMNICLQNMIYQEQSSFFEEHTTQTPHRVVRNKVPYFSKNELSDKLEWLEDDSFVRDGKNENLYKVNSSNTSLEHVLSGVSKLDSVNGKPTVLQEGGLFSYESNRFVPLTPLTEKYTNLLSIGNSHLGIAFGEKHYIFGDTAHDKFLYDKLKYMVLMEPLSKNSETIRKLAFSESYLYIGRSDTISRIPLVGLESEVIQPTKSGFIDFALLPKGLDGDLLVYEKPGFFKGLFGGKYAFTLYKGTNSVATFTTTPEIDSFKFDPLKPKEEYLWTSPSLLRERLSQRIQFEGVSN